MGHFFLQHFMSVIFVFISTEKPFRKDLNSSVKNNENVSFNFIIQYIIPRPLDSVIVLFAVFGDVSKAFVICEVLLAKFPDAQSESILI
jgi:hypothetical protein